MEAIKLVFFILIFSTVYGYIQNDDFYKIEETKKYNCDMLIGGWHPDVPLAVQEECRKLKREYNAKSN